MALGSYTLQRFQDVSPMTLSSEGLNRVSPYQSPSDGLRKSGVPVSAVSSHMFCPRQAYLQFKMRVATCGRTKAQQRGVYIHDAMQTLLKNQKRIVSSYASYKGEAEAFEETLTDIGRNIVCETIYRHQKEIENVGISFSEASEDLMRVMRLNLQIWLTRLKSFSDENGLVGKEQLEKFVPHREFDVYVAAPELGISVGRIDIVENSRPLEVKTGQRITEAHAVQVALYAMALESSRHYHVDLGYVDYVCVPRLCSIRITSELRSKALREVMGTGATLASLKIPSRIASENSHRCKVCQYEELCDEKV